MEKILNAVKSAQDDFRELILASEIGNQGLEEAQYIRYLQMQYHLVRDVQKQFFAIAGQPSVFKKRKFSEFLLNFGVEEGPHFKMAERDLTALGAGVGEPPLDEINWFALMLSAKKKKQRPKGR